MSRPCVTHHRCDCTAERLAALEAETIRLRAALAQIVAMRERHPSTTSAWPPDNNWECVADDMAQAAYQALTEKELS